MGMTPQNVTLITQSPLAQDALAKRRREMSKSNDEGVTMAVANARSMLENAAPDAAKAHVDLLDSEDERVRASSASAILDRVGIAKAPDRQDQGVGVFIAAENVQLLQVALEEAG